MCVFYLMVVLIANVDAQRPAKIFQHGTVTADVTTCSTIGSKILQENGSAVDSYIATVFCLGVFHPMYSGLGGGGVALVYSRQKRVYYSYDYTGSAPAGVFDAKLPEIFKENINKSSRYGPLPILVPSQLKGLWEMWKDHGRLPWQRLIQPIIDFAERNEIRIEDQMINSVKVVRYQARMSYSDENLVSFLQDENHRWLDKGSIINTTLIVQTLKEIQRTNISLLYGEKGAQKIAKEIQEKGGIITKKDLTNYTVKKRKILQTEITSDLTLSTIGPPFEGGFLSHVANILSGYNFTGMSLSNTQNATQFYHILLEAFKFALGNRAYNFDADFSSDPSWLEKFSDYVTNKTISEEFRARWISMQQTHPPEYYGDDSYKDKEGSTSHTCVMAEDGEAVSGTNSINFYFGSLIRSKSTGIIWNNGMNDFSDASNIYRKPPSKWNKMAPHKRPASSMSPVIITRKNGDIALVIGASGGPRIPMAIAQVIWKSIFFGVELGEAVDGYRLFHKDLNVNRFYQYKKRPVPLDLIEALQSMGHLYEKAVGRSVVQAIYRGSDGILNAASDTRKESEAAGY